VLCSLLHFESIAMFLLRQLRRMTLWSTQ